MKGYRPVIAHLFSGYRREHFLADLGAGLTVGIIALPLSIGFAIASGVKPEQGLWTAIIAGIIVSLLGGSRFQVAGPTGAFVPVLAGIVAIHGYAGLALATILAGGLLIVMGVFRFGALLRYIPYPVVAGFTSGIAVIIFLGQIPAFLGLEMKAPPHAPELVLAIVRHGSELRWQTGLLGLMSFLVVMLWPRITSKVPAAILAVIGGTVLAFWLKWPVETIASRYGELPAGLPGWHLPEFSLEMVRALAGPAFTIAMLGAIESLLSATVADGMTDSRHDSNAELIGQGLANIAAPLFGGFAATGAIARTAANIRSGARSPVSGLVHAVVLVLFVFVAAPFAGHIPLATLAAVLMGVAIRMAEWHTFVELWRGPRADFFVMLAAFVLTVLFDLTVGVSSGLVMAVVLFVKRMEETSQVHLLTPESDSESDGSNSLRGREVPDGVVLFRFEGPLFFAAVEKLEAALRASGGRPRMVVFRLRHVPAIDATALHSLEVAVEKMQRDGVRVLVTGLQPQPSRVLESSGLLAKLGDGAVCESIAEALEKARAWLPAPPAVGNDEG
ncbi:MAG: SulP family inorganic anion transporter [Verrucomicrobiales bacterium]|nr:sulfate permease [Verrucomicrobiae bacterium]MCP5552668.1 sulfate permease [Akkermansiaceae bacterium]